MKNINKELLDQLNLKQRSGVSPRTRVTDISDMHAHNNQFDNKAAATTDANGSSIIEGDSILDMGSSIH